jgi:hypothetical protein
VTDPYDWQREYVPAGEESAVVLELGPVACPWCGHQLGAAWDSSHPRRCGSCGAFLHASEEAKQAWLNKLRPVVIDRG